MIPKAIKEYFNQCDWDEQETIVEELLDMAKAPATLPPRCDSHAVSCPSCQSGKVVGNGKLKGVQRYRCKSCGKYFSETTGSFLYYLQKPEAMPKYIHCLMAGFSIRKSASECGISMQTSFDWRHKLLTAFDKVVEESFEGITESMGIFFRYSEKGLRRRPEGGNPKKTARNDKKIAVVATCDRLGHLDFRVAFRGILTTNHIAMALQGKMENAVAICTDARHCYDTFANGTHTIIKPLAKTKSKRTTAESVYHMRNITGLHGRLREFMAGFHGVATKYLQNYLHWFMVLEKTKFSTRRLLPTTAIALASNSAWFDYKQGKKHIQIRT